MPCPFPGDLPYPGIKPESRELQAESLPSEPPGKPPNTLSVQVSYQSCLTLCNPMNCSMPGFPDHHQLPEIIQTHVHRVGDAIQLSHPLSFPSSPVFNFSQHQSLFQCPALCNRWPKNWGFSLSISPSNESSGLISFRMYWLDLLAVLGIFSNTTVRKYQFFGT